VIAANLKRSTKTISLRLPAWLLDELKVLDSKQDIPYQSLLKMYLSERIAQERKEDRVADPPE
jgi:predicted DNA binding CopG/RHH family protein